jgi:tetratricopeptide (TPR) repeat protein
MELDDRLHAQIVDLCQKGDLLAEEGSFSEAISFYNAAFNLVPEPFSNWEASTWILTALADAHFLKGSYSEALNVLREVMHCPDAIGNPFIHLRFGEVRYELGDMKRAADELTRAYIGGGVEIFEDEDPKYLSWLKTIILPPTNSRW